MNNVTIFDKKQCCGCTACSNICPKSCIIMKRDNEGFFYPMIDGELCINCGLCRKACPIIYRDNLKEKILEPKKIYATKNKNISILNSSSSGGMFKEISDFIIDNNGVVFGVEYDENFEVVYSYSTTSDGCEKYRGSKYSQSSLGNSFKNIESLLKLDKKVLFVGNPCYVEGLKLFLRKEYQNLYTCDLICHGTPSPKLFKEYIKFIEYKNNNKIKSINMKCKKFGWENPVIDIRLCNNKKIINTKETRLWTDIFYKHYATRPSCHSCKYTNFNRSSDITIGDYWGVEKVHPEFYDSKGVSLVFVNTKKGEEIFNNIKNNITYIESTKEKCIQPNLYMSAKASEKREEFWKDYEDNDFEFIAKKYLNYTFLEGLKSRIKVILNNI